MLVAQVAERQHFRMFGQSSPTRRAKLDVYGCRTFAVVGTASKMTNIVSGGALNYIYSRHGWSDRLERARLQSARSRTQLWSPA